jgi:hypothetical protein
LPVSELVTGRSPLPTTIAAAPVLRECCRSKRISRFGHQLAKASGILVVFWLACHFPICLVPRCQSSFTPDRGCGSSRRQAANTRRSHLAVRRYFVIVTGFPYTKRQASVAQLAEQLICNQQVVGSSPSASSVYVNIPRRTHPAEVVTEVVGETHQVQDLERVTGGFPSGQRGQTVNLMAMPSQVRILHPPLRGCSSMVEPQPSKLKTRVRFPSPALGCCCSSVGRARPW